MHRQPPGNARRLATYHPLIQAHFLEHHITVRDGRCLSRGPRPSPVEPAWFRSRFPTRPPTREGGPPLEPSPRSSSALSLPPLISIVFTLGCRGGTRYELGHFPDMILVTGRTQADQLMPYTHGNPLHILRR